MYRNRFSFFWKVLVRIELLVVMKIVRSRKSTDDESFSVFQCSFVALLRSVVKS